jgi:hypothetical protein
MLQVGATGIEEEEEDNPESNTLQNVLLLMPSKY